MRENYKPEPSDKLHDVIAVLVVVAVMAAIGAMLAF